MLLINAFNSFSLTGLGSRSLRVLEENRLKQQRFEAVLAGRGREEDEEDDDRRLTAAQIKEENRLSGYLDG